MTKNLLLFVAAALSPVAFVSLPTPMRALAQTKGCTACHQVDRFARAACYAIRTLKEAGGQQGKVGQARQASRLGPDPGMSA